jgi:hypothetical protein
MKNQSVGAGTHFLSERGTVMIHGIYLKSKPKNKWHLVSLTLSPETANSELDECMKQAISIGNDQAQVAIQLFDSVFWIPDYIDELVPEHKPQFN